MSLPARVLSQLVAALRTDATRRCATDKRTAPRVGFRHPISVFPTDAQPGGDPVTAWIRNLSAKGIGLLTKRPLPAGSEFTLHLDRTDAAPLHVLYRVTRIARVGPDLHAVGARFICVVEPARRAAS